ncbi:MAG: BON domain-containing protein [Burkholderiales bacterium]|nr:BON domain-containing protein [Burkholderiales bacterium]
MGLRTTFICAWLLCTNTSHADDNPFHDPYEQATSGYAGCIAPVRAQYSEEDLRREAHQRMEAGTTCWLAGQCEQGGPYKHDAEINADIVAAIRADKRFAHASVWVETVRSYVTLHGCMPTHSTQQQLEALVKSRPRVKIVWNKTVLGRKPVTP